MSTNLTSVPQWSKDLETIRKATCDCMSIGLSVGAHEARIRLSETIQQIQEALGLIIETDPDTVRGRSMPVARRRERYAAARAAIAKAQTT